MMTHAVIEGHHPVQVVTALQRKAEEGLLSGVQHPDWIAGNPRDPLLASGGAREGVDEVDHSQQWSKSLFYGDWLSSRSGETQNFLEIQIKRISGSDPKLLDACGISPEYVWLPLADERGRRASAGPGLRPSLLVREPSLSPDRALSPPRNPFRLPAPSASDKGKGKDAAAAETEDEKVTPRPLPDPILSGRSAHDSDNNNPFEEEASIFVAQRVGRALKKNDDLKKTYAFLGDPTFRSRMEESFVYAVRIVAIPVGRNTVNCLTGPPIRDRQGTILAMGGWAVPPIEERLKHRDSHTEIYVDKVTPAEQDYKGLPKKQIQIAMPIAFDHTGTASPRYYGELAPVWRELCDPTLEDVHWMAWQLASGKQFCGFLHGHGFGIERKGYQGDGKKLEMCPFESPSSGAVYHGANYLRGKDKAGVDTPVQVSAMRAGSPVTASGSSVITPTAPFTTGITTSDSTHISSPVMPAGPSATPTMPCESQITPSEITMTPAGASTTPTTATSSAELAATRPPPSVADWLAASPYHVVNFSYPRGTERFYGVSKKVQPRPGPSNRP